MVYDEEPDERRREKFSRERGGGQQDFRRPFERSKRGGDFAANGAMKRSFRGGGGDDDQHATKRGRFEAASESYEPTFHRRDSAMDSDGGGTTTLLTFKKFLATQDESLTDEEAITKYTDYKLLASDLGVMVNRDLKRRVRISSADTDAASAGSVFTSALDSHRSVAANALRQAARLIVLLDLREGLHGEKMEMEEGEEEGGVGTGESDTIGRGGGTEDEVSKLLFDLDDAVLHSRNPILAGIANYMVEESSVEEEFLLEKASAADGTPLEITQQYEEDRALIQMLDRLLLYLRIVHSVDFYAAIHYAQEDQMPNRLGLFHVRRIPPPIAAAKRAPQLAKSAVDGHVESFNARFENGILKKCTPLAERELQKLGKKDAEKAVEEFVNVNTQQLGAEKWLCPLSGKKFKGPEFVHKHITTKYKEEVDKMRHDALYFNNFITDPNRPHNPQLYEQPKTRGDARPSIEAGTNFQHQSQHISHVRDRVDSALEPPAERISFQRNASSWGGGGGTYGGDRYGGSSRYSGARPVMNTGGWRRMEPMNETAIRGINGGGGEGMRDPRAPPSYKDLDAPTEDII
uniref:ARS2 domain-containing protein n=1 Tax=Globodera pallida TaxID=36090 RepID=A0A183BYF2_GLOPA